MKTSIVKWLRVHYQSVINSIAFYPVIIAILFLFTAFLMVTFDYSEAGKDLKSRVDWMSLQDPGTARSIISTIAAGIISLTVFSFSMVMIVLNQAASQMSNRVLDNLIGNRFQQVILGIYIGTIVYSLFLLSTIRDNDAGIYIPALSIYLLITFTIVDIFIFIYFLHYITRSVKYETIIHRIFEQTLKSMQSSCRLDKQPETASYVSSSNTLLAPSTGIFQGFNKGNLMKICKKENIIIKFLYVEGSFLLEGTPYASVSLPVSSEVKKNINLLVLIHRGNEIDNTYYYGLRQLGEVAVKALSPGVNDPGTAIESLRAISGLLFYRLHHFPDNTFNDEDGIIRIITTERSFDDLFNTFMLPIWDYGNKDRMLRNELLKILLQFDNCGNYSSIKKLLQQVQIESMPAV